MLLTELKIKHKTLSEEIVYNRLERRKNRAKARNLRKLRDQEEKHKYHNEIIEKLNALEGGFKSLQTHDDDIVSKEARSCHIAYSLMKGKSYHEIERIIRYNNFPNWKRIKKILSKFNCHNEIIAKIGDTIEAHEKQKEINSTAQSDFDTGRHSEFITGPYANRMWE